MINKFTEKGIVQKIIVVLIFLVVFNFVYPYVPAFAGGDDDENAPGGILFKPLFSLISAIGEGIVWIMQSQVLGLGTSNFYIDTANEAFWSGLAAGAAAITTAVVGGVLCFALGWTGIGAAAGVALISVGAGIGASLLAEGQLPDAFFLPNYQISPQEIFSDVIPALNVNFINPSAQETKSDQGIDSAKVLQPQVSKWYTAIRNMVLVGLMVVLLYIGIRIILSSTAGEKAKYKEHIKDWLVAVILVVTMHYIMAFALTITHDLTKMISKSNSIIAFPMEEEQMKKFAEQTGTDLDSLKNSDGKYYYGVNLMGYARLMQQMESRDDSGNAQFTWSYIGYTIMYLMLVMFTATFLVIYFKRVIYMAFLTMVAPLVALTYPIDKISDGKAQAFDMWLKEYVYNLLLQPFHLILYTMLVGSAMELATSNMLYAIVALGFLIPAEKLLRKFFGFEKASLPGSMMGNIVGGSLAMNAINKIGKMGPPPPPKGIREGNASADKGNKVNLARGANADNKESTNDLISAMSGKESEPSINDNNDGDREIPQAKGQMVIPGLDADNNATESNTAEIPKLNNNETETFDPNSKLELLEDARDFAYNSAPANAYRDVRDGLVDWNNARLQRKEEKLAQIPDTRLKRDAKRLRIRAAKTLKAAGGTAMHYAGNGFTNLGKKAPRVMAKVAGAGTAAAIGVAAGMASGDIDNAIKYGVAAASVGKGIGDNAATTIERSSQALGKGAESASRQYLERKYTKDELKAKQNEALDKQWRKEQKDWYKKEYGKDWKNAMDEAQKFREYGITDDEMIKKVRKQGGSFEQQRLTAQMGAKVGSYKDVETQINRMIKAGVPEERAKQIGKNVADVADL